MIFSRFARKNPWINYYITCRSRIFAQTQKSSGAQPPNFTNTNKPPLFQSFDQRAQTPITAWKPKLCCKTDLPCLFWLFCFLWLITIHPRFICVFIFGADSFELWCGFFLKCAGLFAVCRRKCVEFCSYWRVRLQHTSPIRNLSTLR